MSWVSTRLISAISASVIQSGRSLSTLSSGYLARISSAERARMNPQRPPPP